MSNRPGQSGPGGSGHPSGLLFIVSAPSGTRPRYYTDNGEDALIMWTESVRTPAYQDRLRKLREQLFARLREEAGAPPPSASGMVPPRLRSPGTAE